MHDTPPRRAVRVQSRPDGATTYLVDVPPEALPPVQRRDLSAAWEAARAAATAADWGSPRCFRFRRGDGGSTDLVLADPDACCWAGAVDRTVGMGSIAGLSLCLRLLALVELLTRASWTAGLFTVARDGTELHPALLGAAATTPLTADARFDEGGFRGRLARLPGPGPASRPGRGASGVSA